MGLSLLQGGGSGHREDPHPLTSLWDFMEKHPSYLEAQRSGTEAEAVGMEKFASQRAGKSILRKGTA